VNTDFCYPFQKDNDTYHKVSSQRLGYRSRDSSMVSVYTASKTAVPEISSSPFVNRLLVLTSIGQGLRKRERSRAASLLGMESDTRGKRLVTENTIRYDTTYKIV
jgi:hypothetical protein